MLGPAKVFTVGTLVRVSSVFTDLLDANVDPTTFVFELRSPTGVITTPSATKDAVGVYHVDIDTTLLGAGRWYFRAAGSGAAQAATENYFVLTASQF